MPEYTAAIEFRNAYGELPAAQIAKLPFYGGMTLVYAVMGIFWAFLYVQHRHDILAVQNYITAIIIFLIVEMLLTWGFYDYQNVHGSNVGAKVFMIVVSILNAGRNSFSFFLLLIVCMGYGVVKPSFGKTMVMVRWLAAAHFVFGVIYAVASLTIRPDDAGPLVLLVILPLSATLTAFYIWTLNSLSATMKDLVTRKQHVKASMYRKLWYCILASILVIFAFFFFNSFTFAGVSSEDFAPTHWQTRWFVLDGWLNLVYLADVAFVAYLWRPTDNNRRFAMSDEVPSIPFPLSINIANQDIRSPKTMKGLRLAPCVTRWTPSKTALSTGNALHPPVVTIAMPQLAEARHSSAYRATKDIEMSPPCQRQYRRNRRVCRGKVWTGTRSSRWETKISGVMMKETGRRGRGWWARNRDIGKKKCCIV